VDGALSRFLDLPDAPAPNVRPRGVLSVIIEEIAAAREARIQRIK
jgi:hypothetical protein